MNRIGDYALIGDCHSAALVGRDGSVDWCCFPRFDSPAIFCRILDSRRGGEFSVRPQGIREVRRAYLPDTNVLQTLFRTASGVLELTDCMPLKPGERAGEIRARHAILRRLRCLEGVVEAEVSVVPRFFYGAFVPRFRLLSEEAAEIVGGADALWVTATRALEDCRERIAAYWRLRAGEEVWVEAAWSPSHEIRDPEQAPRPEDFRRSLEETVGFWRGWVGRSWYEGEYAEAVRRSALVLKALTYAPTGAVVAAPTTSLPEAVGGERNWDYRYTWIRDATLTLASLLILGFREEADAFKVWLERTGAGRPEDLQVMYGIGGERWLPELTLDHLEGHRGSRPVRIGNGAVRQRQLDCYGALLDAAYLYGKAGGTLTPENWNFLAGLADLVCEGWRQPDQGIWEIRDQPRHFVHSKLYCWVALDRAVRIAQARRLPAPLARWERERDAVAAALLEQAREAGWFTQAWGWEVADASTLLVPALGFLPTTDPLCLRTVDEVRKALEQDGLLYRYMAPDGLAGGEGAFLLCSFWLADCLTHAGRLEEAGEVLERLVGLANDVGLYAEEADPRTGEALGNFPQAFTHMALVTSAAAWSAARRGQVPFEGRQHYAELALDRLAAAGRRLGAGAEGFGPGRGG